MNDTAEGETAPADAARDEDLSYEQARDELTSVVRRLEAGGLTLQESMDLWERGERLAKTCEAWLEGARAKLAAALAEHTEGDAPDDDDRPF